MSLETGETTEDSLAAPRVVEGVGLSHSPTHSPRVLIRSEESGVQLNLGDLWAYRELLYFLTLRDIKVRYKQTLMGVAWVIVQPLATMLLFTLVFNKVAHLDSGALAYPLFAYSGLLLWTFFSVSVTSGTNSLISNTSLVTKVYFPRVFITAAAVGAGVVDLGVGSLLLAALAVYYRVHVTWGLLLLPAFVLLTAALALGVGMLAASLTVKYRDLRYVLPFLLQLWMFASPVVYPAAALPGRWRWLLEFNPMTGILEGFRASLAGLDYDARAVVVSVIVAPTLLAAAFYVFRKLEDTFADVI
jgi:lipopolysaccharide transport system permease protein